MRKKRIGILLVILCVVLTGCGTQKNEAQRTAEKEENKLQIGLSIHSLVLERWQRDRDIFVSFARELGAEINVQNANGDIEEQKAQIRYFIEKGMDTIVIIAGESSGLAEVVREAEKEEIKVISYDRMIEDADVDLHISFNNQEVGRLMADSLRENVPEKGEVFLIQGPSEDANVQLIRKGFEEKNEDKYLNVVYETNCKEWMPENAAVAAREAIEQHPDVAGILCGNDELAGAVFQVLAEKQMAGKVALVGQDGDLAACQRIVEGFQDLTVYKDIGFMARTAARYAVRMGESKEEKEDLKVENTIYDGEENVPYLELPVTAVTGENIDQVIIQQGFHLKEDVYLNVEENE